METRSEGGFSDRVHWYDGAWYARFIDPLTGGGFGGPMRRLVPKGSTVIDIACGTGALAMKLASHCRRVVGVDRSSKMIAFAERRRRARGCGNVAFRHGCVSVLAETVHERFDYAVLAQVLHGLPPALRQQALAAARHLAERLIVADFTAPRPRNFFGKTIGGLEYLEGRESFVNYRDWMAGGGLEAFLAANDLEIEAERVYTTGLGKIVRIV